jgi:tetratricopeptide (TPR) repeat protein
LIGRQRELGVLREAVARASAGEPAFLLVVGEPGIGKSTMLAALSDLARGSGMPVGFGRGQPDGTVPLSPWRSALAAVAACGRPPCRFGVADEPVVDAETRLDGGLTERFAYFEEIAGDVAACAAGGPVAIVLDDVHWADVSALRLLRHLLDHPELPGLLLAAALRTTEPLAGDAWDVVSGLLAHPRMDVVELRGFDPSEIAAFAQQATSRRLTDAHVGVLTQRSGGNPFMLAELLRWAPPDGTAADLEASLPLAVRESVRRRLVVEDAVTQQLVKTAAIAGSVASLELLAKVTAIDRLELGSALDAAARAGLLDVDDVGSVGFVHDLVRESVLMLLPTWDRLELHHAVGLALRGGARSWSWTAVVGHLLAAGPLGDNGTLADAARHAAAECTGAGAFDEAAEHLALVLNVTDPDGDTAERGRVLLERGRVLWAAERAEESCATLTQAAELARRTSDGELLARVALSWRGGELRAIFGRPDRQFVALLREALAALPPDDDPLRCLLLARWVRCGHSDITDVDLHAAIDEAEAMARRLGDPEAITAVLGTRFYLLWRPELARDRLATAEEILAAAVVSEDPGLIADARYFRTCALLDLGWLRDAWSELEQFEQAAVASGQPMLRLRALWFRVTRHLVQGDRAAADDDAEHAWGLATRMGRPDAGVERLGQMLPVLAAEDRVDEVLRHVSPGLLGSSLHKAVVAWTNGLGGRPVEAQAALAAVVAAGLDRSRTDMMWLCGRCGLLAAAAVAGDRETAQVLYDELVPFAPRWAVINPGIMVLGAVDHFLGVGAAFLGRLDAAVDHLRRAARAHEDEEAAALALLSLHELAAVLARMDDPRHAGELEAVGDRIARIARRNTVPFKPLLPVIWAAADAPPVRCQVHRLLHEGDTWLVEFDGSRARLRDQRGLHHLQTLLQRPGVEIPALVLAGGGQSLAGAGEAVVLDPRAMREYRQRITDLHDDIDEATTNHDIERAARAQAELDTLVEHLSAATGVGGRSRRFDGSDERARVSVTKAIRSAINHLGQQMPDLGRHLAATVHTGTRCTYRPDPRAAPHWTTEQM